MLDDTLARLEASALGPSVTALDNHEVVVTRILVSAATIQLHSRLARSRPGSRERCLTAARIIAAAAQNLKAGAVVAVDPIVAVRSLRHPVVSSRELTVCQRCFFSLPLATWWDIVTTACPRRQASRPSDRLYLWLRRRVRSSPSIVSSRRCDLCLVCAL